MTSELHLFLLAVILVVLWKGMRALWAINAKVAAIEEAVDNIRDNHLEHIYDELGRLNSVIMAHFKPHDGSRR